MRYLERSAQSPANLGRLGECSRLAVPDLTLNEASRSLQVIRRLAEVGHLRPLVGAFARPSARRFLPRQRTFTPRFYMARRRSIAVPFL